MNKHAQILLLFLTIFIVDLVKAQNVKVDSLENLLKTHHSDDSVKVNLLNGIASLVLKDDSIKAKDYAAQAGKLSDKMGYLKGKAESLWVIGSILTYYNSNKLALDYFLKAVKIAEAINFKPGLIKYLGSSAANYANIGNIQSAIEFNERAIKIAIELKDNASIGRLKVRLYVIYTGQGDYKKATDGYDKLIPFCKETKNNELLSSVLINMGCIQEYQGNYTKALEYYHQSLKVSEENSNKLSMVYNYANIGGVLTIQGNYQEALEYIEKALKIAESLNDKRRIALCYENIGAVYMKTNNVKALEYLQKALSLGEELSYTTSMLDVSRKIGEYYLNKGKFEKSLEYYQKALLLAEEMNRKRAICEIWYKIGEIDFKQKEYAKALNNTLNGLKIADEMKLLTFQCDIHHQLSEIYAETGDFANAYHQHKIYQLLSDSIFSEKNIKKIAELEYIYKFEKEKQAIELGHQKKDAVYEAEQQKQGILIISLVGGFLMMSLLAFFLFRSVQFKHNTNIILSKKKREIEELNVEYVTINEELKQSNEQLFLTKKMVEESEEKLSLLIKNSSDIIVLANEEGEQFFISDVAKKLTGYDVDELLGEVGSVIYPDDIEIVRKHWDRVLANKSTADTIQYRHKHKEKAYVWFEAVAQNFLDNPAIKAIVANIRDISERKKNEQELQESERKLSQIIEQISDALVIFDNEGKIVIWNSGAEKITRLTANETLNKKIADIQFRLAPESLKNKESIEKTIAGILSFETPDLFNRYIEDEILLPDNTIRNIQSIYFPIDLGTHDLFGSVFRDITEKKYIEKQLEEYNAARQKLLSMELDKINNELELNQKSITAATLKLIQNSERDNQTIERLMEIEKNTNQEGKQLINMLIADYKRKSYNSNWDEFEILFEKVHHSFYEKLNAQFPNLTGNERKICAFLKLNMSSKDIAQITFQSEDALKKARLRLRQKFGIDRETNLTSFLQNI
jgi:PAS domain S-box-containing protein